MPLTEEVAQKMILASQDKARELGVAVSTAIFDAEGRLFAFSRMVGAYWFSIDMAQAKAFTGSLLRRDGPEVKKMDPAMLASVSMMQGRALVASKSITTLSENGRVFASIGCSGGSEFEDGECAKAAFAAYAG